MNRLQNYGLIDCYINYIHDEQDRLSKSIEKGDPIGEFVAYCTENVPDRYYQGFIDGRKSVEGRNTNERSIC